MPANLNILIGDKLDAVQTICSPVVRVGDAPDCDLTIANRGLLGHELTIEYRAGKYRVYNRRDLPLTVDGQSLAVGAAADLYDGSQIVLAEDVELQLTFDGDPKPSIESAPVHAPRFGDEANHDTATEAESIDEYDLPPSQSAAASSAGFSMQALIVVGCLIGIVLVLVLKAQQVPEPVPAPSLKDLLRLAVDGQQKATFGELQRAELMRYEGRKSDAYQLYSQLRNGLFQKQLVQLDAEPVEFDEKTLRFVESRLQLLAPRE